MKITTRPQRVNVSNLRNSDTEKQSITISLSKKLEVELKTLSKILSNIKKHEDDIRALKNNALEIMDSLDIKNARFNDWVYSTSHKPSSYKYSNDVEELENSRKIILAKLRAVKLDERKKNIAICEKHGNKILKCSQSKTISNLKNKLVIKNES